MNKAVLACAALLVPGAALATLVAEPAPPGPSPIGSDTKNGKPLRVASKGEGTDKVSFLTEPKVGLACTPAIGDVQSCSAWVVPGSVVKVTLRRKTVGGKPVAGAGLAPTPTQWRYDCAGTVGATCTVTVDKVRTAMVDWTVK